MNKQDKIVLLKKILSGRFDIQNIPDSSKRVFINRDDEYCELGSTITYSKTEFEKIVTPGTYCLIVFVDYSKKSNF